MVAAAAAAALWAERLGISMRGAELHVSEVIGRLGVDNRYQAARWPERAPWWAAALSPVGLFWRRAGAALPFKASSAAMVAAGGAYLTAMAGLALIAALLLFGDGGGGEPIAVAGAPGTAGPPGEEVSIEVPGVATPEPPTTTPPPPGAVPAPPASGARPVALAAPRPPDATPTPTDAPVSGQESRPVKSPLPSQTSVPTSTIGDSGAVSVDCDAEARGVQSRCFYPPGVPFVIQVSVTQPVTVPGDYSGFWMRLEWIDSTLSFSPAENWQDQVVREHIGNVACVAGVNVSPPVMLGCIGGQDTLDGAIFQLAFQCQNEGTSPLEIVLGGSVGILDPALISAQLICVAPTETPTPTPGP